jgi:hypothetical protein
MRSRSQPDAFAGFHNTPKRKLADLSQPRQQHFNPTTAKPNKKHQRWQANQILNHTKETQKNVCSSSSMRATGRRNMFAAARIQTRHWRYKHHKKKQIFKKLKNNSCATDATKVIQLKITVMIISWS